VRDEEFDDLTYEQLIQVTLKEFEEEEHAKKKRINILAKKLVDEGTPKNMISQKISRDLQGLVDPSYVRDCLGQAYKDRKQVREQTTSQARESTPADEAKKVLVKITNKGKQETSDELPTPKEQTTKELNLHRPHNDVITIESLQDKVRIVEKQRDYFAKKLAEKSPEFPELYEEIEQLQEIESRRIKHHDFKSAASLPAKNELQQKIDSLEERIKEQDNLLAKNRFEAEFELKEEAIPLIILINRVTGRAEVMINATKMKG
jgi:hypothetical protein